MLNIRKWLKSRRKTAKAAAEAGKAGKAGKPAKESKAGKRGAGGKGAEARSGGGSALSAAEKRMLRRTPKADLQALLARLRPQPIREGLIRIGGEGDGGYLIPDCLTGIAACFSPGVSTVSTFEDDLAARGIPSFMADHSVDGPAIANPLFHFEKKFLGDRNDAITMRLEDWVTRLKPGSDDLLLQMDIEWSEFPVIYDTPEATLNRFRILCIEFHEMEGLLMAASFPFIAHAFDRLLRNFTVVHIHMNNCTGPVWHEGIGVSSVMEFTFLRKDWVHPADTPLTFPHPLDRPNLAKRPDLVLPDCWWKDPATA